MGREPSWQSIDGCTQRAAVTNPTYKLPNNHTEWEFVKLYDGVLCFRTPGSGIIGEKFIPVEQLKLWHPLEFPGICVATYLERGKIELDLNGAFYGPTEDGWVEIDLYDPPDWPPFNSNYN